MAEDPQNFIGSSQSGMNHSFINKVPACIWKYCPAADRYCEVSDFITELSGLSKDEVLLNAGSWTGRVDKGPESRNALRAAEVAREKGEHYQIIYLFHTLHNGLRWFQSSARPSQEDGQLFYYGTTIDITELRHAEQARIGLASALEQADEAIIITGLDGKIQYVNPAFERMTGYTREETLGRKPNIVKSGKHDASFYKGLWQTILKGEAWRGRLINKKKDGSIFEQWATITPVHGEDGRIVSFVAVQLDMTYQLQLERQLQQAERLAAIGETIAGVAHYMKNVLHTMKSSASVIDHALKRGEHEKIGPMWEIFLRNSARLLELTRHMLDYSRISKPELEATDLNSLAREVFDACLSQAREHHVELIFDPAPNLPLIPCDKSAIHDAILNLVGNAVDALSEWGGEARQVILQTAFAGDRKMAEVSIEDNGPGIPTEILKKIFNPFFSTKGSKGSGLGLATVQKMVREHKGTVDVVSEPGRTVFTIQLPV